MPIRYYAIIIALLLAVWPRLSQAQAAPTPPTNVRAAAIENAPAIKITWQASATPGVTYRIYRSQSSGSIGDAVASFISELSYTDTGVVFNSTYYYRLVAMLSGVSSQFSFQAAAKPVLPAPINVRASDTQKGGEIKITWDRPTLGLVLKFNVYRSKIDNILGNSIAANYAGTEYFDSGVTNNTFYYYRVASVYDNGQQSAPSDAVVGQASDAASPEKPTISASASEGGRVSVSWSTPRNEQGLRYVLYRSVSFSDLGSPVVETANTSFNESALDPNQIFYYRVVAKDGAGNVSLASNPARVATIGYSAAVRQQLKVTELLAEGTLNRGEIRLRWKFPNSSEIAYSRIYRRLSPTDTPAMIANKVYANSFLDKGAEGGKRYYYFIRLVNKIGYEYEAGAQVSATSFTEKSTSSTSTSTSSPNPTAKSTTSASPAKPAAVVAKAYAYNKPRLANLKLEAALANNLRKQLVKKLGPKKVPVRLNPNLIKAYLYGGYVIDEIADTIINGPGLVHPMVRAVEWRRSAEYKKYKKG